MGAKLTKIFKCNHDKYNITWVTVELHADGKTEYDVYNIEESCSKCGHVLARRVSWSNIVPAFRASIKIYMDRMGTSSRK